MDAVLECCAGLDVHQQSITACVLSGPLDHKPRQQLESFGTTTKELLKLQDWLHEKQCSHVAMESTGVYWKPVWNVLEGSFTLLLANSQRIKNLPGRKTDMSDAVWITKLLRSGLIEGSFVPPVEIRDLRDCTRYRRKLLGVCTSEKNRIHKVLQDANIKLTTYLSDVFGSSGRALLEALANGEYLNSADIRDKVHSRVKQKVPQLIDALNGRIRPHHRRMIRWHLDHLDYVEGQITRLEQEIDALLEPYQKEMSLLQTIPGVKKDAAAGILSEIGADLTQFPTEQQMASWAGVCPGNHESAGKKKVPEPEKAIGD